MSKKEQQPTGQGGGSPRGKSAKQYSTGGQLNKVSKSAFSNHMRGTGNKGAC